MQENNYTEQAINMIIRLRSMRSELRQNPLSLILQSITHDFFGMLISPEVYYSQLILFGYTPKQIDDFVLNMFTIIAREKLNEERNVNDEP